MSDPVLGNLVGARIAARAAGAHGMGQLFSDHVTADKLETAGLLAESRVVGAEARASIQQALDFIMATRRAMDLRSMSHQDHIAAARAALEGQAGSEWGRVSDYLAGRF